MNHRRRVLITGSTGYIGYHLTSRLLNTPDIDVYGFNRTYDARLPANQCMEGQLLEADLLSWLAEIKPDVIFHAIGSSPKAPFEYQLLLNAEGTRRLLQALVDNAQTPKVIILGSASEYGLRDEPVQESAICAPEGEYGIAKLTQTHIAQSFARRYDFPVVVGRIFNVYGQTGRHLAVASLASQVSQAEAIAPLPSEVHVYNLRSQRDFVHIDDVVDALMLLSDNLTHPALSGQIYNIASGQTTAISTILDILLENSTLGKEALKKVALHVHGQQREDTSWADISKLSQYGWKPHVPLTVGLQQELHHWRSNVGQSVLR